VIKGKADAAAATARASLADDNPLAALLDDVRAYVSFNVDRAAILQSMSGEFEQSPAGLQHAAHLYEGEGKLLGMVLGDLLMKHRAAVDAPAAHTITAGFSADARAIVEAYADRVVGF
jgi:hypothetical protein